MSSLPPSACTPARAAPAPRLLALDTATETLHLALVDGAGEHVREFAGGSRASAALIPALQALLDEAGVTAGFAALDAIAFGRGPGAFTGLRTAASVAQGLAFGAGCPVIPLDTLLASAEDARQAGADVRCVWVLHDARMGEVYCACYAWDGAGWHTLVEPRLGTPLAWGQALRAEVGAAHMTAGEAVVTAVAGNALESVASLGDELAALGLSDTTPRRLWPQARPSGRALAALARTAWQHGAAVPAAQALPLYVRDKVAFTTAEREAMAAQRGG